MALSYVKVRAAQPEIKVYKLADDKGMVLLVHPNGSKYWRLRYRFGGKGNDSNLLIVFYVQIMPDDFVMQLHRF
ncbi:phage integrase [Escherichia coli]|nr:phage integrase [Escherichia coli]